MKKILIISGLLLTVGGILTVNNNLDSAQQLSNKGVQVTITPMKLPTTKTSTVDSSLAQTDQKTSQLPQNSDVTEVTNDQNRAQLQNLILGVADSRGMDTINAQAQWWCLDMIIANGIGYSDYNATISASTSPLIYRYLTPIKNDDDTTTYLKFDGAGTCRQQLYII